MLSIAFDPTTTTSSDTEFPPKVLLNTELKKCFLDAATIFNTHLELYPNRWNTAAPPTGSAYINTVVALYFNLMYGHTSMKSRQMHEVSRYVYSVASDYYSAEINTLSDDMPFSIFHPSTSWQYRTSGFQFLRSYGLFEYCPEESEAVWICMLEFCNERGINLAEKEGSVEVKVKKVITGFGIEMEVPDDTSEEVLNSSLLLLNKLGDIAGGDLGLSIQAIKLRDKVLILRKGQECQAESLDLVEVANISNQLKDSPSLLINILKLGMKSGSIS